MALLLLMWLPIFAKLAISGNTMAAPDTATVSSRVY